MDTIIIQDLTVSFHVGVTPAERTKPQQLLLTLELGCDFARAAQSDDVRQTVDYAALCEYLFAYGNGRSWRLIEKLAVDLAESILTKFNPRTVSVEVKKFILPHARFVGVRVRRPTTNQTD